MAKCTAHLICEVHRKLTLEVALSFGFDRSFLWSTEIQNNLVSIQPHLIDRLRTRYSELCPPPPPPSPAGGELQDDHEDQLDPRDASSPSPPPSSTRVELFFARWDDFTQRYCVKRNKGREECVLQAFRHGRRPHDAEFDRLLLRFTWLLHESRLLFPSSPSSHLVDDDDDDGEDQDHHAIAAHFRSLGMAYPHPDESAELVTILPSSSSSSSPSSPPGVSPRHEELGRSLDLFFGAESDVAVGFREADFVFSSTDGRSLRWRPHLLAHLMRDLTDSVLGLFGLRQSKSGEYPFTQLTQIHDSVLRPANIDLSSQRWAELYKLSVTATHLNLNEEDLSPQLAMDAVWVELTAILSAVFVDTRLLVRAIVAFLSSPPPSLPSAASASSSAAVGGPVRFPNHNQIHVLGNLLDLPLMQREPYCRALASLHVHEEYWRVLAPQCRHVEEEEEKQKQAVMKRAGGGLALQAACLRYLARMVRLNARLLAQMELLVPPICSWIANGPATGFPDDLRTDLRFFGGLWGSLIIHDIIAGIHGFVNRSIRGCDTRALKQRIVEVTGSVLGGVLHRPHLERIVSGGSQHVNESEAGANQEEEEMKMEKMKKMKKMMKKREEDVVALEKFLYASHVIDQFGVVKAKCLPHACLAYVCRNFTSAAEQLIEEAVDQALNESAIVLERIMGLAESSPVQGRVIDQLITAVLHTIAQSVNHPHKDDKDDKKEEEEEEQTAMGWTRQLTDVVRSAVAKMCIGTGAAVTMVGGAGGGGVQPQQLPPHTARRQTRKYVRTRRKIEQEVDGPVRVVLQASLDEAARLAADLRPLPDSEEGEEGEGEEGRDGEEEEEARKEVELALEEVVAALRDQEQARQ